MIQILIPNLFINEKTKDLLQDGMNKDLP